MIKSESLIFCPEESGCLKLSAPPTRVRRCLSFSNLRCGISGS